MDRAALIDRMRRRHVRRALKRAVVAGKMTTALVDARLAALGRATATPSPPWPIAPAWTGPAKRVPMPKHLPPPLAVLAGRELVPSTDWSKGYLRVDARTRLYACAMPRIVEHMEIDEYRIMVRMSKRWTRAETPSGTHRWQYVGTVTTTRWHRVAKFLRRRQTLRLSPEELYMAMYEHLYGRPYPTQAHLRYYTSIRRRAHQQRKRRTP